MSRRPAQSQGITFTVSSTAKVLVLHSLSPTVKEVKDHYIGVSHDSGDVKERSFVNCRYLILYESK